MARYKLLLADDSITIQKVVNLTFADEGIEVATVGNGNLAVEKILENIPDLVLADVHMPGLNGYEVCERVKQHPRLHHIPVMLLVGSFEPFDKNEAARVGADDYLTKPFQSIRQLVQKVNALLTKPAADEQPPPEISEPTATDEPATTPATADFSGLVFSNQTASDDVSANFVRGNSGYGERNVQYGDAGMDDEMIETSSATNYQLPAAANDFGEKTQNYNFGDFKDIGKSTFQQDAEDLRTTAPLSTDDLREFGAEQPAESAAVSDSGKVENNFELELDQTAAAQIVVPEDETDEMFDDSDDIDNESSNFSAVVPQGENFFRPVNYGAAEETPSITIPVEDVETIETATSAESENSVHAVNSAEENHFTPPLAKDENYQEPANFNEDETLDLDTELIDISAPAEHQELAEDDFLTAPSHTAYSANDPVFDPDSDLLDLQLDDDESNELEEQVTPVVYEIAETAETLESVETAETSFAASTANPAEGLISLPVAAEIHSAEKISAEPVTTAEIEESAAHFAAAIPLTETTGDGHFADKNQITAKDQTAPTVDNWSQIPADFSSENFDGVKPELDTLPRSMVHLTHFSPDVIDAIAQKVVEKLSIKVIQEIAWEIVPELSEILIRKQLEEDTRRR